MAPRPKKLIPDTQKQVPVKATLSEVETRVGKVHELLVIGQSRPQILQYCATTWGIEARQTDEYLARARQIIIEQTEKDRDYHLAIALARLDMIFHQSASTSDNASAIAAQRELNKIIGLYAPTKQDVNVTASLTWADMVKQAREGIDDND